MSTYIYERDPNRFGDQQQNWIDVGNILVKTTAETFRNARETKQNLVQLFHKTLASLGEERNRLANNHGTKDANQYGFRRDKKEDFSGPLAFTLLGEPYSDYNDRLLTVIQKQLKTMDYDHYGFKETDSSIPFEAWMGRKSRMEYSIITEDKLKNWPSPFTEKEYQRFCGICGVSTIDIFGLSISEKFYLLMADKNAMQKLKQNSIKDYKYLKLTFLMLRIREHYPNELKSDYVHVTVRSEINGKLYALSEYFTWLYRDYKIDPVDDMTGRSVISIVSHDPFLLETTLDDIANIFKSAIEWDGKNIKDLKNLVALFRYELSHAMPFERGSAAVAEWYERALYLSHGIELTYPKNEVIDSETKTSKMKDTKMIDLEALTSSLKEFVDNYDSMIELHKISEINSETLLETIPLEQKRENSLLRVGIS